MEKQPRLSATTKPFHLNGKNNMTFIKIITLILFGFMLTSCHFAPKGLYNNEEFILDDNTLHNIKSSLNELGLDKYYMHISGNTDDNFYITEEIYVNEDDIFWYSDDTSIRKAYKNGIHYEVNSNTERLEKKNADFSIERYKEYLENTYLILNTVLSSDSIDFNIDASYSLNFDDENYTSVAIDCIGYYDTYSSLKDVIPNLANTGIRLEFTYNPKDECYYDFIISWNTVDFSFYVMLEEEECPEILSSTIYYMIEQRT